MRGERWEFWIDVGGTFTDCIGRAPDGALRTCKVLSSGVTKGIAGAGSSRVCVLDPTKRGEAGQFFRGYTLHLLDGGGERIESRVVEDFDAGTGALRVAGEFANAVAAGMRYELSSGEEAPIAGIRRLMELRLEEAIGAVSVRLGTTRGTNALLERKGAKVGLVTTKGFADVLEIGTQARPSLFDLSAAKPSTLYTTVVEIGERIDAQGNVLEPMDEVEVGRQLGELKLRGIESLAIVLLNSYVNPVHERKVAAVARGMGFGQVSVSTELSPTIKMVHRGDTAVVDAYLAPIIRKYVAAVKSKLPAGDLKLMTSFGGLVGAESFLAKDSILSGPAGGVVGFSQVAGRAGFSKAIGFDMGGTSTDVARFDGKFEYQFETEKAGVRVVAPMFAIETVAAGGGSICEFDGQKLVVGPESAGADPGPACYGRGGPLTITDVNLINGKIDERHFPFALDRAAAVGRLKELKERMGAAGFDLALEEIADGFTRIANHKMAAAIKTISMSKGYNPAEYALVSFGGAGAQHACAVAEMLGISRILLHPLAGLLSAYGIGMADVRRFAEQTVLRPLTVEVASDLVGQFGEISARLRGEILAEGILAGSIRATEWMLDLRYQGEESAITVAFVDAAQCAGDFAAAHRRLYGYVHENRVLEVVTLRVEVVGETPKAVAAEFVCVPNTPLPAGYSEAAFNARKSRTAVFQRVDLKPGDLVQGPALIFEGFSTIVIDPGWKAELTANADLLVTSSAKDLPRTVSVSAERDPTMLELFNNQFTNIATQMGIVLQKTSISVNVKERLDFSCAILDATGDLVVNAPHIPVHLGAMSECVKALIATVPDIRAGQVYLCNDPDLGGSHLPDLTVMTPVFDEAKRELLFFAASRAHHSEIGGIRPGSATPFAENLAQEGVVFRNLLIVEGGEFQEERLRRALTSGRYPSRSPRENIADLQAAIAANQAGANELMKMIGVYSWPVVNAYMTHIRSAAEEKMRAVIRKLRPGDYVFNDSLDDGARILLKLSVRDDALTLDFTGSGPVNANSLNANRAIVQSAVLYCLRCIVNEDIPLNSGLLAPVTLIIPEGMLSPPRCDDPEQHAAVVGGNTEISQRVVDVILGALGVQAASQGTMNNFIFGNEQFGYYETICGGCGAGPGFDGASSVHSHMTNTRITDVEVFEKRYPVRLREFSIRRGSGGKGRHCGGDGVIRSVEFLGPLQVSMLTQRRLKRPFGLEGGEAGAAGVNLLCRKNGREEVLPPLAQFNVEAGDVVTLQTPGGGGFGITP